MNIDIMSTFAQDFDLDQLNNWANFTEDDDGNGTDDLAQSRTHNDANEITDITETTGPAWATPAHDAAGNLTTIPQPATPTSSYTATYDAWNRLVKLEDGANTVAEYEYDGQNRRIVKSIYSAGSLDHTEHRYLSQQDQVLEVRIDSSTDPNKQFTWGARYIDDLVMRTRDTDANGTLDETLYALQDAGWNITALTDTSGTIVERFKYDPYGKSTVLDADFTSDADNNSDYAWEFRFTSREFDLETGLHYFRARYYHDDLGSFIGRDPLLYVSGMNLYGNYFSPHTSDPYGTGPFDDCCTESEARTANESMLACFDKVQAESELLLKQASAAYKAQLAGLAKWQAQAIAICDQKFGGGGIINNNLHYLCITRVYAVVAATRANMLAAHNILVAAILLDDEIEHQKCINNNPCYRKGTIPDP